MINFILYNKDTEEHYGDNVFYIGKGSMLANPYTHEPDKDTDERCIKNSRVEAVNAYEKYFYWCMKNKPEFKMEFDSLKNACKSGQTIYVGCHCHPKKCHGDFIKKKIREQVIKEELQEKI
ncbi:hypothetical protein EZS27_027390 [termite gut metagenome]|uniref:DUF4326 domain-containing protein n=1 Tax=termite gut metagenome TaxID=433724 RepID=A0A5J4QQ32_9ZZZZ